METQVDHTTDAERWPDVAAVPHAPLRAAIASALLRRVADRLPIRVATARGTTGPEQAPTMRLHRPDRFLHRLGTGGLIGFGESYQAGDWDADDLAGLLTVLATHLDSLVPGPLQALRRPFVGAPPEHQDNSPANARRNVAAHYDLSNDLFATFLDPTMTYSAALFGGSTATWELLADAQRRKIDRLLDRTGVGEGSRVLEIGTGWGELAVRAAERGAHVHTITLSERQHDQARLLAADRGVGDRVDVELRDYRELDPQRRYDAVLSVEMIEAVGERYWPAYFAALRGALAPGGRIGLQAITMRHKRMRASRHDYTWIHKYVFPGGIIPSVPVIEAHLDTAGLRVTDRLAFGGDYAQTLRLWRERLHRNSADLAPLGFDRTFERTWDFYLAYSQAGFASGHLDVRQLILEARR